MFEVLSNADADRVSALYGPLADAVREGGDRMSHAGGTGAALNGFSDSYLNTGAHATAPSSGLLAPPEHRSGRRRGHLRVLPDPAD